MGLVRGMARTAVIAGTATAVSNKVSRRQAARWQGQQQAAAPPPEQYPPEQYPPQQYAPPPGYASEPAPPQQYAAPPGYASEPSAAPAEGDVAAQLDRLAAMRQSGALTDEEFAAAKAKLLGL